MSIINQALQNVDSQGRPAVNAQALPGEVRFAEPTQRRSRPIFLIALAVAAMFIAGGLFLAPAKVFSPFMAPVISPRPVMLEGVGLQAEEPAVAVVAALEAQPASAPVSQTAPQPPAMQRQTMPEYELPSLTMAHELSAPVATPSPPKAVAPALDREPAQAPPKPRPQAKAGLHSVAPIAPQEVRLEPVQLSPAQKLSADIRAANDLMDARNYPAAEARLREALKQTPSSQAARLSLARLYATQFKRTEAKAVLSEGLLLTPNEPALLLPLARLSADENQWQVAADTLAPATSVLAGNAEYLALKGAVLQGLGRFAESAEAYRAAIAKAPQTGVWWVGYALSLEADGQTRAASEALRQALTLQLPANVADFVQNKLSRLPPG